MGNHRSGRLMAYKIVAPLVLAHDQEGKTHHRYHGAVIHYLSDEQREHLLRTGLVEEVDAADPSTEGVDDGDDESAPVVVTEVTRPPDVATKPVWVAYVVAKTAGTEKPVSAEEADKLTRDDLVALYGS